jgi:hypothetical protein
MAGAILGPKHSPYQWSSCWESLYRRVNRSTSVGSGEQPGSGAGPVRLTVPLAYAQQVGEEFILFDIDTRLDIFAAYIWYCSSYSFIAAYI